MARGLEKDEWSEQMALWVEGMYQWKYSAVHRVMCDIGLGLSDTYVTGHGMIVRTCNAK